MTEKLHHYASDEIEVTYSVKRCIHAAECVRGLPRVFKPDERPWIQPAHANADEIATVIMRCPTGALHFERKDGGAAEQPDDHNSIKVVADGPLYVRGDLTINRDGDVTVVNDTRVALCRCGASSIKPFCDNSHKKAQFHDAGTLADQTLGSQDSSSNQLIITATKDGPYHVAGAFALVGSDDTTLQGDDAYLCRCGGSNSKPFCDGTHAKIGFTD